MSGEMSEGQPRNLRLAMEPYLWKGPERRSCHQGSLSVGRIGPSGVLLISRLTISDIDGNIFKSSRKWERETHAANYLYMTTENG